MVEVHTLMSRYFFSITLIVLSSCGGKTSGVAIEPAVRVSSTLLSIEPITMIRPMLPTEATRQGVLGPVILEVRIDEKGDVSVLSVLRGDPLLNELAQKAVSQWKYDPVVLNGQVISVVKVVAVSFQRGQGP